MTRSSSLASSSPRGLSPGPVAPVLRFNDPQTADFVVSAEQQPLYVHRSVLMSQSPFLRQFLQSDPSCNRINANNAKYIAMKAVLGALYILPPDLSAYTPEMRQTIVQQALRLSDVPAQTSSSPQPQYRAPLQSDFNVVLSIWEICLHFQLSFIGHFVMSQLMLPLLDRRNVARALKGALKHQKSSSEAQTVIEWCLDNELLPPELDSAQSAAEWESLCTKYPWLKDAASSTRLCDIPLPQHQPHNHVPVPSHHADTPQTIDEDAAPVTLNDSTHQRYSYSGNTGHDNDIGSRSTSRGHRVDDDHSREQDHESSQHRVHHQSIPHVHEAEEVSPQLSRIRTQHNRANQLLIDRDVQERQDAVDAEVMDEIERERRLLREEENQFQSWSSTWQEEQQHLRSLADGLESQDLDVIEILGTVAELERQKVAMDEQQAEIVEVKSGLEIALRENDEYLQSTAAYLPAASQAFNELSAHIASWSSWISGLSTSPMEKGALLRQTLAQFASSIREEKDTLMKGLESESRIQEALRAHVEKEQQEAKRLQSLLDNYAAGASSAAASR